MGVDGKSYHDIHSLRQMDEIESLATIYLLFTSLSFYRKVFPEI